MKPVKSIKSEEILPWDYIRFTFQSKNYEGIVTKVAIGMVNVYVTVSGRVFPLKFNADVTLMTKD